jgi:VWFA-related protein
MSTGRLAATWLVMLLVLTAAPGARQQFRTRVDLVRLDVIVTRDGDAVEGMTAADFHVEDNGVAQVVSGVTVPGRLAVALLVDVSESVTRGRLGFHRQARPPEPDLAAASQGLATLVATLEPSDEVSLLTVGDRLQPLLMHGEVPTVSDMLSGLWQAATGPPQIRSPIWDSVLTTSALIADRPGRPVVVLVSDGTDNASWLTQRSVIEALQRTAITVDLIQFPRTYDTDDEDPPGRWNPRAVSDATGGLVVEVGERDLAQQLRERIELLRTTYVLTYEPKGVGLTDGWHRVSVRLRNKSGRVSVRPGYFTRESGKPNFYLRTRAVDPEK